MYRIQSGNTKKAQEKAKTVKYSKRLTFLVLILATIGIITYDTSAQGSFTLCFVTPIGRVCTGTGGNTSGPTPVPVPQPVPPTQLTGRAPSLPPFPGMNSNYLPSPGGRVPVNSQGTVGCAVCEIGNTPQPALAPGLQPSGVRSVPLGTQFPVTISRIDMANWTTVLLADFLPSGRWTVVDLSGFHSTGANRATYYASMRGTDWIYGWADNDHNGRVSMGEVLGPLVVNVF